MEQTELKHALLDVEERPVIVDPRTRARFIPLRFRPLTEEFKEDQKELALQQAKRNNNREARRIVFRLAIFTADEEGRRQNEIRGFGEQGEPLVRGGSWTTFTNYFGIRGWEAGSYYKEMLLDEILKLEPEDVPSNIIPKYESNDDGYVRPELLDWFPKDMRVEVASAIDLYNTIRTTDIFD